MPLYEFDKTGIGRLKETTFSEAGLLERQDLQRLLRENIEVIAADTLVIAEEFGDWEDSRCRIDLLGVDKQANLVVIELKRTDDGGYMELQALRYAAMVSAITFEQLVAVFERYLARIGQEGQDAQLILLDFLGWDEPDEDEFGQDVRIILASAEFSRELTSSVMWLVNHDIDISCIRLKPYSLDGRTLVDVQQIIPLPEAAEYQEQVREKVRKERQARNYNVDFTQFDVRFEDERHPSMWKRNALFLICKRLCERNVTPEDILKLFSWRPNRVWYYVDGEVNAEDFKKLAGDKAASGSTGFRPKRWFCEDDELIHAQGRTYAFSNQWGGQDWHNAMGLLKNTYPQYNIEYTAAT